MPKYRSILGIDLRVASVKIVEIELKKEKALLKNWGMVEIPFALMDKHPQKEDAQAEALRKLVQGKRIRTPDAAVVVGGADVYVKLFTLSEVSKAEVADAIKWKFAEEVPFPIEEAIIDFYPLSSSTEPQAKTDYAAACIHQPQYREIEYIVSKAGLKLSAVVIMPDALRGVYAAEVAKEAGKIVSLIYMGKRTTNISIFKDNKLEFNRELNIGGENITLAMSGVLVAPEGKIEISPEQAEKIKLEKGIPTEGMEYAMVRPSLEKIQDEIMRTFEYYKGQTGEATVDKVILCGGAALTKNLAKLLSEGLGVPVVLSDVGDTLAIDESVQDKSALQEVLPRLFGAAGAALVAESRINLIPDAVKYRWKLLAQKFLTPQYMLAGLVSALVLVYLLLWSNAQVLKGDLNGIQKKIEVYKPRLAALDALQKVAEEKEKRRLTLELYQGEVTNLPRMLKEISRIIPDSVIVSSFSLLNNEVRLWGVAFEKEEPAESVISQFVIALQVSPYFEEVKLLQAAKNEEYTRSAFSFEIVGKVQK